MRAFFGKQSWGKGYDDRENSFGQLVRQACDEIDLRREVVREQPPTRPARGADSAGLVRAHQLATPAALPGDWLRAGGGDTLAGRALRGPDGGYRL